jgi:DNA-binding CsgD family transcriptional regulator
LGSLEPAENHAEEAVAAEEVIHRLGFRHYILMLRMVIPVHGAVQVTLHNWPDAWFTRYWRNGYVRIDPVVAQMIVSYTPFDWNNLPTLSPVQEDFYAEAKQHGFVDGVSGSVRFGSDQLGLFTLSNDTPLAPPKKEEAMAWMMLFTAQCFERVRNRVLHNHDVSPIVLTKRQVESLWGILFGWQLKEISAKMGISVSAVQGHLDAARRKLGERTYAAAARKAIALNLMGQYEQVCLPNSYQLKHS